MRDHNNEVVKHEFSKADLHFTYWYPILELTFHEGDALFSTTYYSYNPTPTNTQKNSMISDTNQLKMETLTLSHKYSVRKQRYYSKTTRTRSDTTTSGVFLNTTRDDRFGQYRSEERDGVEPIFIDKFFCLLHSFWANQKTIKKITLDHTTTEMIDLGIEVMNKTVSRLISLTSPCASFIPFGRTEKQHKKAIFHTLLEMIDLGNIDTMNEKGSNRSPSTSSSVFLIPSGRTKKQ